MPSDKTRNLINAEEGIASDAVAQLLLAECPPGGLTRLLSCDVDGVRGAAIVCLGLKGSMGQCPALARLLWDDDPTIAQLAENSLWQIWMRAGTAYGNAVLVRAIDHIRTERFDQALRLLDRLCSEEPTFAEPQDQRGIALCFLEHPAEAADAFRRTLRLNRYHFSAAVSLGHTYAERSDLRGALRHYRYALRLHPRLDGISDIVSRLEAAVGKPSAAR